MTTATLAVSLLDPHSLLSSFGTVGTFVVPVAETGLLVGVALEIRRSRSRSTIS